MAAAAPSPLASSVEKTNGAKLSRLLIDGGTTVLRNVFDGYYPPTNLAADLNANFLTLNNLLRRKVLRAAQWDQLFPPGAATPDSKKYDITLLFLLLTNICGLPPPFSGWHAKPPPSDTSLEANLSRIKFFRNDLYGHVSTTGVDTPTFNALWLEISAVLVALGLNQTEIDRLSDERCGEDDYLDVLRDWADSDEDINSKLKDIRQGQTETQQQVEKVLQIQLEDHKTLQDSISRLEGVYQTQTTTRQAVEEVHETLQAGLQDVKQEVENLKRKNEMDRAEEILRNLAKSEFKGDIEYHAQRFQEGTREWIFKRVEDWLDDRSSPNRVMVISGAAGMGKSVISAVICKRMQDAGRLSGSHFCQHNNVRYRKPQLMLQSLACHLSHALPEYKNALVEQLSRNLGPVELNSMDVEELFALLLKEPLSTITEPGKNILMVIDGLDESEYQGRNELLNVIANQFCKLPQWIRFFVTTRSEIQIADSLKHLQPLQLEENKEENFRDIRLFFEMQLIHKIEEEHKDVVLQKLVNKSEGVILYAHFLIDFIKNNVSLLTQEQLESYLPLGISSVYLSHFKRLENELRKELKIEEDQMLSFLYALTASREPLPIAFVSRLLNPSGKPFSVQRRINKAIACISSLLPVRDDCLHFFHKSVKDWLTNISCYGQHDFTVDEKEGHKILFSLCWNELDNIKRKGVHCTQFSDIERYALQHGVQHMIEVDGLGDRSKSWNIEELVKNYVTNLELIYAKFCVNTAASIEDLLVVKKKVKLTLLSEETHSLLTSLLTSLRKHFYVLRDHPQLFFQCLVNEGCSKLSSRAAVVLNNDLPNVSYIKTVENEKQIGAVQARFYCSDTVACLAVSPEKDYMVCECRDGRIHMWSLQTGNLEWIRPSLISKEFYYGKPKGGAYRQIDRWLSFYRSVVFHPSGEYVLPGTLSNVYTLSGDSIKFLPNSNCNFSNCIIYEKKTRILTDCLNEPKQLVLWSLETGQEQGRIDSEDEITSFTCSPDGKLIAISDLTGSVNLHYLSESRMCRLFKFSSACGMMHFTPDSKNLACCFLCLNSEKYYGSIYELVFTRRPRCTLLTFLNEDSVSSSSGCPKVTEQSGRLVLWPFEPQKKDVFLEQMIMTSFCWVNKLHSVFPFLLTGFYIKLNEDTALIGSPAFKYVATVNVDRINEANFPSVDERIMKVLFSAEGDTIYAISKQGFNEVLVTVLRMSDQEVLVKKVFSSLVSLIPTKEGVVLCEKDKVPEMWNFELSKCIRSFTELTGHEKLFSISDDLIACQKNCHIVSLYESSIFERDSTFRSRIEECDDSHALRSPPVPIYCVIDIDSSFDSLVQRDVVPKAVIVDTLQASIGALVSSVEIMVPGNKDLTLLACNGQHQLLLCTIEEVYAADQIWDEEVVTISLRNNGSLVWERSSVWYDKACLDPHFIFSQEGEFVVTWKTLAAGYGLHILDAKNGETRHVLFKDHDYDSIVSCSFVGDGKYLVCCSRDNFLRLVNVQTGDLLSLLDIEEEPFCLGACLDRSLLAVGLATGLKFFHVVLPRVKDTGEKQGCITKRI